MLRHTGTPTYSALLAPVDARIAEIRPQLDELAGTIASKKAANEKETRKTKKQPTVALENRFNGLKEEHEGLQELARQFENGATDKLTNYLICKIRAELRGSAVGPGWAWCPEAERALTLPCLRHEGPGEKSVGIQLGMPMKATHAKKDRDDGDVKWAQGSGNSIQPVTPGISGQIAWNEFMITMAERGFFKRTDVDPEVLVAFRRGEVPKNIFDQNLIPADTLEVFNPLFRPSVVLGSYGNLYLGFNFGYNLIPQADADEAWALLSITKCKPRYVLKREYSLRKMFEESTAKQKVEVAA